MKRLWEGEDSLEEKGKNQKTREALLASEAVAADEASLEASKFDSVRKNRVACIAHLVQLAQRIERVWDVDDRVLRAALMETLRDALLSLRGHKDRECAVLADLGEKMKSLDMDLKHFLIMVLPIERQHTRGLRDDEFLVTRTEDVPARMSPASGQVSTPSASSQRRMPLVFVLDNMRSAFNVGAVFRTADCLGLQKMYLCGYTATPEEAKGQVARASMGAHEHVPWEARPRTLPLLFELKEAGMHVVALETVADARYVQDYEFPATGVAVLLGNERCGLEADLLACCTGVVRIPCRGVKNSLNVGIAAAVCGYEIARQWGWDRQDSAGASSS